MRFSQPAGFFYIAEFDGREERNRDERDGEPAVWEAMFRNGLEEEDTVGSKVCRYSADRAPSSALFYDWYVCYSW